MSKRIMLITQWFDPEPTFKGLLFAKELVGRGFDVEVITGFPNYPGGVIYDGYKRKLFQREFIDGVSVTRVPLFPSHDKNKLGRILNYLSFAFSALVYGLFFAKRADIIYSYHPPLTVGLCAVVIKFFRRIPIVYDIQDMWPDTLRATGMLTNRYVLRLISKICTFVYSRTDQIVVLSPGFKEALINRGVESRKIEVIYNWADEKVLRCDTPVVPDVFNSRQGFSVLFAGNVGKAQGLDVVLDAALLLKDDYPTLYFIILGHGLMLNELQARSKKMDLHNLVFIPAVSMEKVGSFLQSADALLVHLNKDPLFEITIPGKTQAYMAMGKPMIMGVPGDASNIVIKANCGICIEPGNAVSLADAAKRLMNLDRHDLQIMGANAALFYDEKLSVKVGVDSFSSIFSKIVDKKNV